MTNETKHTPTPWTIKHDFNIFAGGRLVANTGGHQSNVDTSVHDENVANAEFIVRACNSYDAMLTALEYIVNDSPAPGEDAVLSADGYNRACAAIKKARGL